MKGSLPISRPSGQEGRIGSLHDVHYCSVVATALVSPTLTEWAKLLCHSMVGVQVPSAYVELGLKDWLVDQMSKKAITCLSRMIAF